MDASSISTMSALAGLLASFLTIAVFVWIALRTGSTHMPMYRFWQLIYGSQEVSDPTVKQLIGDETSLMQFRFMYGIRAESLAHIYRLHDWCAARKLEMSLVGASGKFFDAEKFELKKAPPARWLKAFQMLLLLLALAAGLALSLTLANPGTLVHLKVTGRPLLISADQVRPLNLSGPTLSREECKKPFEANEGAFNEVERSTICEQLFAHDEDLSQRILDARNGQRWFLLALFILLATWAWQLFRYVRASFAAHRLRQRLDGFAQAPSAP